MTLDTVVAAFNAGAAPEDSLRLEDVYLVVGYYLRHRAEVDAYLTERRRRGEDRPAEAEARLPWSEARERLLARRRRSADTSPGR